MPLYRLGKFEPRIAADAWIAPTAQLIGRVTVESRASIWFNTVLRGDINEICIGEESNIQDHVTIHLSDARPTLVGRQVTVGHQALLHACTIGDHCLIGMGAIVMDGCEVGARSLIGAGALLTANQQIPAGSLVLGSPARVVRTLSTAEQDDLTRWADAYTSKLSLYRDQLHPLDSSNPE